MSLIRTSIIVPPQMMGKDWKEKLFEKISKEIIGKCTQEHGYILAVHKIVNILDQTIMRTGGKIRFTVDFEGEILKPLLGDTLEVEVDMITPHGLFCRFKMLRMLLPLNNCGDYLFRQDFSCSTLYHHQTQQIVKKGDKIKVKVENVRFENDLYSCIVSLLV